MSFLDLFRRIRQASERENPRNEKDARGSKGFQSVQGLYGTAGFRTDGHYGKSLLRLWQGRRMVGKCLSPAGLSQRQGRQRGKSARGAQKIARTDSDGNEESEQQSAEKAS